MNVPADLEVGPGTAATWMRAIAKVARLLWRAILVLVALMGLAVGIARAKLPATACAVSQAQIDVLVIEKMSYADVVGKLGCDGVRTSRQDYGEIIIETYRWRGATWPYGTFEGEFINGQMHGTSKVWLYLKVTL